MYNRNHLHVKLYQGSGQRHVIRKTQKMLAVELAMSQFTLNRIMSEMVDEGRLRIIGKGNHAAKTYLVSDPIIWCRDHHDYAGVEYAASILEPEESTTSNSVNGQTSNGRTIHPAFASEFGISDDSPSTTEASIDMFMVPETDSSSDDSIW